MKQSIKIGLIVGVLWVLLIGGVLVVSGQNSGYQNEKYSEGFEDGNIDEYNIIQNSGSIDITENAHTGQYALSMNTSSTTKSIIRWNDTMTLTPSQSFNLSANTRRISDNLEANDNEMIYRLTDGSESVQISSSFIASYSIGGSLLSNCGSHTSHDESWQHIKLNMDYETNTSTFYLDGQEQITCDIVGEWQNPNDIELEFGVSTDANGRRVSQFWDNLQVTAGEGISESITLDAGSYMPINSTQNYEVVYTSEGTETVVTDNATVTSENTSVITVDGNTLTSTGEGEGNITAEYISPQTGITLTDNQKVVSYPRTIDHIEDLPSSQWIPAVLGMGEGGNFGLGSEMQWVLLAIVFGATAGGVSRNEWVGNGVIIGLITLFWVMDNITLGIMLVSWTYGIFIMALIREIPSRTVIRKGGGGGGQQPPPSPNDFQ